MFFLLVYDYTGKICIKFMVISLFLLAQHFLKRFCATAILCVSQLVVSKIYIYFHAQPQL